ncbi:MAG: hypothetical protein HC869_16510 [Rhodospirillales bacterium]|nr:hypothetical protein [Rhodospirillales bacterium]
MVINGRDDLHGRDDLCGRGDLYDPTTNRDRLGYAGVRAPSRSAIRERQRV